jgi:hypothetical protein
LLHGGQAGQDRLWTKAEGYSLEEACAPGEANRWNGDAGILQAAGKGDDMALFNGCHALIDFGNIRILLGFRKRMIEVSGIALIREAFEQEGGGRSGGGHLF